MVLALCQRSCLWAGWGWRGWGGEIPVRLVFEMFGRSSVVSSSALLVGWQSALGGTCVPVFEVHRFTAPHCLCLRPSEVPWGSMFVCGLYKCSSCCPCHHLRLPTLGLVHCGLVFLAGQTLAQTKTVELPLMSGSTRLLYVKSASSPPK